MNYNEVKAIFKRKAEDDRNWRGAEQQFPELFDVLEAKERAIADRERALQERERLPADLAARIQASQERLVALQEQERRAQSDTTAASVKAREWEDKNQRLRNEVEQLEHKKAALEADLKNTLARYTG